MSLQEIQQFKKKREKKIVLHITINICIYFMIIIVLEPSFKKVLLFIVTLAFIASIDKIALYAYKKSTPVISAHKLEKIFGDQKLLLSFSNLGKTKIYTPYTIILCIITSLSFGGAFSLFYTIGISASHRFDELIFLFVIFHIVSVFFIVLEIIKQSLYTFMFFEHYICIESTQYVTYNDIKKYQFLPLKNGNYVLDINTGNRLLRLHISENEKELLISLLSSF